MNGGQVLAVPGYCGPCEVSAGNSAHLVVGSLFSGGYALPAKVSVQCFCRIIINITVTCTFMVFSVSIIIALMNVVLNDLPVIIHNLFRRKNITLSLQTCKMIYKWHYPLSKLKFQYW